MSGNTSDMKFNNGWIKTVRQALQKSDNDFLLYTADSAAVTEDNLKLLKEYHVDMISRLPERYDLAEELIDQAIIANNWTEIGTLSERKKAATYRSVSFERELCGDIYRFVVVHSSSLDKRKLKTLNSKVEKTIKKSKRGRYKKGEIPLKEKKYLVKFEPVLRDMEKYSDREILSQYKGILLMAAQVYTILERVVRKNLENPDEKPVEGLNQQKTKKPTAYAIEYVLSAILVIRILKKKCEEWILSKELNKNQKRILKLAGFDESIYYKTVRVKN